MVISKDKVVFDRGVGMYGCFFWCCKLNLVWLLKGFIVFYFYFIYFGLLFLFIVGNDELGLEFVIWLFFICIGVFVSFIC